MEATGCIFVAPVIRRGRQPDPRRDESGLVKRVWLLLYAEGGTWTEHEIRVRLHLSAAIHAVLRTLSDRGFLARSKVENIDGETSVKYGVARRCKVPRGVTLDEMWDVLQMAKPAE
jgi:hypothetical protein